ncbi:MAG: beta-galactosidase trimerization domain-containing protein [Planctomycetaceae bacterium]|nr:beta-galactosidase trimerization domain-containing protein [Planctomycetaceae bacterium]
MSCRSLIIPLLLLCSVTRAASEPQKKHPAETYAKSHPAVKVQPDGLYICEAEEFQSPQKAQEGWQAKRWGENYYAATFANSFLSRKAFLGAPPQCEPTKASRQIEVKEAGKYLVLVRYEAAYRFETQFQVQIEQDGKTVFNRKYGARDNLKIWAFRQKLKTEVGWSWGAVENIVWEGHDAFATLKPGKATLHLIAGQQPEPPGKRNIDLVMLTTDVEQVQKRIETENYLPLDGMLTQSGDVWMRVKNLSDSPLTFQGRNAQGGGNWQQHSPYWVHQRNWKSPSVTVPPKATSDWVEVGSAMDSLNDGQWFWTGNGKYQVEFALKKANGIKETIATFQGEGALDLAADADTRYSHRLRTLDQVLYDLLAHLKDANPAPHGKAPKLTPIYASTFTPLNEGKHAAAVKEFKQLFSLSDTSANAAGGRGYIDVRSIPTPKLEDYCQKLGASKSNITVVSLGDEIRLPNPRGKNITEEFHAWLKSQKLKPEDIAPGAKSDWNKIAYNISADSKSSHPGIYYWSKRYQYHYGIQEIKQRTDILRKHLPNANVGANFSPPYPQEHMFLGEVYKWASVFRQNGMTMPWSEDYIWQVPVGTPQMNHINFGLFRAGLRHHPNRKIHYYVMPHMPNNTPDQWQRLFYGALGQGTKIVNLFEFRPVQVAYTENHVDDPAMYVRVLKCFRELGLFEDILQNGKVRSAETAIWFSETGDIWGDSHGSFAAAKRGLYMAIRHQQVPLDVVVEPDALDGTLNQYRVLYLTDAHVSESASKKLVEWVNQGGTLFATAGAGMFDELNRPNTTLRKLLGIDQTSLEAPDGKQLTWLKQDLPFAEPISSVEFANEGSSQKVPVFGVRSQVQVNDAKVLAKFEDNTPAVMSRQVGKGIVTYCAFLPSLSYYHPAIPKRPVDRGATDDAMIHFLPTDYEPTMTQLIAKPTDQLELPVICSQPLVETTIIQSKEGAIIPLVNWTGHSIESLKVKVKVSLPSNQVTLASGKKLIIEKSYGVTTYQFNMDAADALIFR